MSYCKDLDCADIDKIKPYQVMFLVDYCEQYCDRYFQCDTVAYMNDKLKETNDNLGDK